MSLEVRTGPVPEAKTNDKAVNYHVSFDLAIKNDGTDEYNIPSPAGQLWNVVVFQRDSGKVLKWNWTGADATPASLAAGHELKLAAEWDPQNDADSGSYVVTKHLNLITRIKYRLELLSGTKPFHRQERARYAPLSGAR